MQRNYKFDEGHEDLKWECLNMYVQYVNTINKN